MGPIGVWGPHELKGWWTGHMGQPHHALRGPCGRGLKPKRGGGRPPNPNPRVAGLEAKPPLPPALGGDGAHPPWPPI